MKAINKVSDWHGERHYTVDTTEGRLYVAVRKYRSGNRYDGFRTLTVHSYTLKGQYETGIGGINKLAANLKKKGML